MDIPWGEACSHLGQSLYQGGGVVSTPEQAEFTSLPTYEASEDLVKCTGASHELGLHMGIS